MLSVLSGLGLLLTFLNIGVSGDIRALQVEVVSRQQFINESSALGRLNTQIIQALASLSAQSNDESIRTMLSKHGVTFTVNPNAAPDESAKPATKP